MTTPTLLVILLFIGRALLDATAELLNLRDFKTELPADFQGIYDPAKYETALRYQRATARFGLARDGVVTVAFLLFLALGGFGWVDQWARSLALGHVATGLLFGAVLSLLRFLLQLPFSVYDTFVLEERFGFNQTTLGTFVSDLIKAAVLGACLGGVVFAAVIWFFEHASSFGWLYAWCTLMVFQFGLTFLAPVLIMPLFNKFTPIEDGPLRSAIASYTQAQKFQLSGVFTMDSSRRSTKGNAFFTGFGKFRRLVLFDTLVKQQEVDELVSIVAHEIGHFKLKHILKSLALSVVSTALLFYGFSVLIRAPWLFEAFRVAEPSVYAGIILSGLLYSPVLWILGIFTHALSRRFEFEADQYAARTYGHPEILVSALKKLSIENLSNLKPHRLKVLLEYTHPPILERIAVLKRFNTEPYA